MASSPGSAVHTSHVFHSVNQSVVYSCLITKLQSDFRKVYNLKGNLCLDCSSACLCPAGSVSRMEMEATVREEERRLSNGCPVTASNIAETYKYTSPLRYPTPLAEQPRHDQAVTEQSSVATSGGTSKHSLKNSDQEMEILETKPDPPPAAEPALPLDAGASRQQEVARYSKRHAPNDDAQAPVVVNTRPWTILRFLGQNWYSVPPTMSQNPEGLRSEEKRAKSPGGVRSSMVESNQGNVGHLSQEGSSLTAQAASHHPAHPPGEDGANTANGQSRFTEHI
ncbi:uncharacterized protein F5Z01DRAFT_638030 [Emericellopsis atlantica]|uniref:Uncharacterized protein n=1 Tax=Emericellopsis atlantica TaxID=2614577 RepID=A0A9P7ZIY8_9HYPO|nr:uncharacterized protein F5Z01DRAFT_638030 [Emericellopsis atlantica]KAG9252865.1 hypothetical protein F5Z01DRAFT_638030 [Emericellopsis atlantica]